MKAREFDEATLGKLFWVLKVRYSQKISSD